MRAVTIALALAIGFVSASFIFSSGWFSTPVSVATLVDGGTYVGAVVDGRIQGQGTVRWPGGNYYEGEFSGGLFHGQGEYVDASGRRFAGTFAQGEFSGLGEINTVDGDVYQGEIASWLMHGRGEYRSGSLLYRGMFKHDDFTGEGELLEDSELVYRGGFERWLYHGEGEHFDTNGSWKGDFEYGFMTRGVHVSELGDRYEGQFRYGEFHGKGTMYLVEARNGTTQYSGTWRNGRLVASEQSAFVENYEADLELALYAEAALLEQALQRVPAGNPAQAEVYFLGIAGDGTQRVFTRDVTAVRNYLDSLSPLGGRQINLLNDKTKLGKQPMATLTSVKRAIDTIGDKMNREQDVLVLYISSHGSKDHEISLNNESLGLADISAERLSALLEQSGIRWRVIFVSACYSGGFIQPLQDDNTLVMTAASATETSFGCSDEAELTYFGQALLKSLPQADDPQDVFRLLRVLIEGREESEGLNSSDPQLYVGKDIAEKLKSLRGVFSG